jgi:D-alanine-D-alanine ligase
MGNKNSFEIVILCGAMSPERSVSLRSGKRVAELLAQRYPVRLVELEKNELPGDMDSRKMLIFPMIHGTFGEDGQLQHLLDKNGFHYIGSHAKSMEITINKQRTKELLRKNSIPMMNEVCFHGDGHKILNFKNVCSQFSSHGLFLKPCDGGSSIHCHKICNADQWDFYMSKVCNKSGQWMLEPLCDGIDLTIGMLHGEPLSIVQVIPQGDFLDYNCKYAPGGAEHVFPAPLEKSLEEKIKNLSRKIFTHCQCRHWARIDFLLDARGQPNFLEVNAIPGFTETSLYPHSALGCGISPEDLLTYLVKPSWDEFITLHR